MLDSCLGQLSNCFTLVYYHILPIFKYLLWLKSCARHHGKQEIVQRHSRFLQIKILNGKYYNLKVLISWLTYSIDFNVDCEFKCLNYSFICILV